MFFQDLISENLVCFSFDLLALFSLFIISGHGAYIGNIAKLLLKRRGHSIINIT